MLAIVTLILTRCELEKTNYIVRIKKPIQKKYKYILIEDTFLILGNILTFLNKSFLVQ